MHVYEVRPRNDRRGVDLISDALPFGRLWYDTPDNAIGYPQHSSRSHDAVIRVYDDGGNVIKTHEHATARAGNWTGTLTQPVSMNKHSVIRGTASPHHQARSRSLVSASLASTDVV